jgi:SAM-dependent methyltransferase
MPRMRPPEPVENSASFWESLYREGGTSGTGSVGPLAAFKAEVVTRVLAEHGITSVAELGCGDGQQLALIDYPSYVGLDVAPAAVERCRERFAGDSSKRFEVYDRGANLPAADLAISLEVIFHLLEDDVYDRYMSDLFASAGRFVLIYSSDTDEPSPWDEVRHHRFSTWVERRQPHWRLQERIAQRYPYVEGDPETSWSDFFLYQRLPRG